jgi:hypothetical protein
MKALIVGIDWYRNARTLSGCVADAKLMRDLVARHADGRRNYDCQLLIADAKRPRGVVTKRELRAAVRSLFADDCPVLFYFSGHGAVTEAGACLVTSDAQTDDWGVFMEEIVEVARRSRTPDMLFILDCCYGGAIGDPPVINADGARPVAAIRENMTLLAAARSYQSAMEENGHGLFTALVAEALDGGGADHMGWVTAPSVYAYVERRFDSWQQRPIYKSNVTRLTVIRRCAPLVEREKLGGLIQHFPHPDFRYRLDPEFEPLGVRGPVNKKKVELAALFKAYRDVGLLTATKPGEDFYWVARRRHTVELTVRGREYWRLLKDGRI